METGGKLALAIRNLFCRKWLETTKGYRKGLLTKGTFFYDVPFVNSPFYSSPYAPKS